MMRSIEMTAILKTHSYGTRRGGYWARLLSMLIVLTILFASLTHAHAQACPTPLQAPAVEKIQQAQRAARNRGYLWKISKNETSSYLYGTIHVGRLEWIFPGPNLAAAFSEADVLALELDPLDEKMQASLRTVQQAKQFTALPQELQQRLDRQIAAVCAPAQAVKPLSPIMQTMLVSMLRGRFHGLEPVYGQELALSSLARQNAKQVISLETAEIQMRSLIPNSPQESLLLLDRLLIQLESGKSETYYLRLSEIWNNSNLADLENFERWCECAEKELDRRLLKRMNDDRNVGMADRIQQLHEQGRRVFAAIGALHMTGNQALPKLMRERGFQVERIH